MKKSLLTSLAGLLPAFILMLTAHTSQAGSATWKASPNSGDWNTAANWTPRTIPDGPSDTATFATSNTTNVSISALFPDFTEVNGIVFNQGASAFTITADPIAALHISGVGITNNSGSPQNFVTGLGATTGTSGFIEFFNAASADASTVFTNNGFIIFFHSSSAGSATFTNIGARMDFWNSSSAASGTFFNLGSPGFGGGEILLHDESTGGNATFITSSSPVSGGSGAQTILLGVATAADAVFFTNGGAFSGLNAAALTLFEEDSTAGNSTLIANAGTAVGGGIRFYDDSTGGTARVEVFGNGFLDISGHNAPGVSTGSIQGSGLVFLGALNLTVGSNNRSTTFSGVIQDGGSFGGTGASLTKIGRGKLVLKHRNTYSGGTTVEHGKLFVNNRNASGTGTGPVQVNGGELGGAGIIAGAVSVGTGSGSGAVLAPGFQSDDLRSPGTLTIESSLTFNSDATYEFQLNTSKRTADDVVAGGVTINTGGQFSFADAGNRALPVGTVFTAITNTSGTPIAGTFGNLPDGSTFSSNGNTYQVSYEGGDGNDLTLTVVP
jgi:autotransporter-associated beta strand protein